MSLSLNCLVVGDDPDKAFTVKVPKTDNVSALKNLIKHDNAPSFAAKDIVLWQVSFPFENLEEEMRKLDLARHTKLSPPLKKLAAFFLNVPDDRVHVIAQLPGAQPPGALEPTRHLLINCFIHGDDSDKTFVVKIPETDRVSILKDMIKEKNPLSMANVDTKDIDLWNVSFPIKDLGLKSPPRNGPKLRPEKALSTVFSSVLDEDCIQIVVRVPGKDVPPPSANPPPSAYTFPVSDPDTIVQNRARFLKRRTPEAPSNGAEPSKFFQKQEWSDGFIPCDRPHDRHPTMPLDLLHPIFGEFKDNVKNRVPSSSDLKFSQDFMMEMSKYYTLEKGRQAAVFKLFSDVKIYLKASKLGTYITDGDLSVGELMCLIAEVKNELGSGGHAELLFQAILYYLESTRNFAMLHHNSVLPCILVLVFGPYVVFAAVVWTDRPIVQTLSDPLSCQLKPSDHDRLELLARHLGALRTAIASLRAYYKDYNHDPSAYSRIPTQPYPTSFKPLDNPDHSVPFKYLSRDAHRVNLFFGELSDGRETAVCIKYPTRYSQRVHEFLAKRGKAPRLYGIERIAGGSYLVVMDNIDKEYVSLYNLIQDNPGWLGEKYLRARETLSKNIKECLEKLHEANLVHGDIRNTNIMVKRSGFEDGLFMLVDFDSSGEIGEVKYPVNLNFWSVTRPPGARGLLDIEAEHDIDMLTRIWELK